LPPEKPKQTVSRERTWTCPSQRAQKKQTVKRTLVHPGEGRRESEECENTNENSGLAARPKKGKSGKPSSQGRCGKAFTGKRGRTIPCAGKPVVHRERKAAEYGDRVWQKDCKQEKMGTALRAERTR